MPTNWHFRLQNKEKLAFFFKKKKLEFKEYWTGTGPRTSQVKTWIQGILNRYWVSYQSSTYSTVPYRTRSCTGSMKLRKKVSLLHGYIIWFESNPNRIEPSKIYGYCIVPIWYRVFWTIRDSRLFFMTELYRLLTGTIWYILNWAIRDGTENLA